MLLSAYIPGTSTGPISSSPPPSPYKAVFEELVDQSFQGHMDSGSEWVPGEGDLPKAELLLIIHALKFVHLRQLLDITFIFSRNCHYFQIANQF